MLYKQHSLVELLIRRGKLWSWIEPRHHFSEQSGDLQSEHEPSSPLTTWVMVAAVRQEQKWETSSDKSPRVMEYEDGRCGCWGLVTRAASPRSTINQNLDLESEGGITNVSLFPLTGFRPNLRPDWQSTYVVFKWNLLLFLQTQSQSGPVVGDVSKDNWRSLGGPGVRFTNNAWPKHNVQPG